MSKTYFLTCSPNFLELYSSQSQLMGNWLLKVNPLNQPCFSSFFCNISVPLGQHAGSHLAVTAAAKPLQSCPTLCNPIDSSPPGSPVPGILQARTLEWVAISFSNAWKWSRSVVSDSSRPHGLEPTRLLHPWDFPGKSTRVGCHYLLRLKD